jgi:hypothetical protein
MNMNDVPELEPAAPPAQPPPPLQATVGLSRAVLVLVAGYVLANLVHVVLLAVLRPAVTSEEGLSPLLDTIDHIQVRLPLVETVLYFSAGICFLTLVARWVRNLPALGSASSLSPSNAVWSFLIPFYNLAGGYRTVKTVWTESQSSVEPSLRPQSVPLLAWWWGTYVSLWIFVRIVKQHIELKEPYTVDQWIDSTYWLSIQSFIEIITGVLFACVVYALDRRQRAQHDDLTRRVPVAPAMDRLR